jgi:23S rRNA (uracil1939-C5)-methyltransferase
MKLQIEKMVYGGAGLAHQADGEGAGKAVFVPFTLPGEVVEAALAGERDGYGEAALVKVMEASSERVEAGCAHFGVCGGCQYQHADYAAQLKMKVGILRETLERAGLVGLPEVQVHAGEAWGYRNRIRMRVGEVDGALRVGYSRRGGNEFLPIEECPIAAPVLWRAASGLMQLASVDEAAKRWMRTVVEVEFFATADESRLQMTLFVRKELARGFTELCEGLRGLVPELVGGGVAVFGPEMKQKGRRAERPKAGARWGAEGLQYLAAGRGYWVSRGGFFQVNRYLVDEMVRVVTGGRKGLIAWDLYAGVGLFARALAEGFEQVVAVEGGEVAAGDLAKSLKGKGMRAVCASTVEFLRGAVVQRERPELVVMDPPRAGVGAEVCALLARVCAREMVYVSCDPVTLARDLKAMVEAGYRVVEVHLVDMFPQTFHLETVVFLQR